MRITIRIDDDLHSRLKRRAQDEKSTLSEVVNETIREGLRFSARERSAPKALPKKTPSVNQGK
jgi:predicted transcriptional regulator